MKMKTKIKNFVALPRKIRDDYLNGKLTKNEFDVLIWIWLNANPVNGSFSMSYEGLRQDFRNNISYDNARKITSSLRKERYIYFSNHKGRKGSFSVYPTDFLLTNGHIQASEYLENKVKNKNHITTSSQTEEQTNIKLEHNFQEQYHNLKKQKSELIKGFSMDNKNSQITTSYNDNDNKNNNYNIEYNIKEESNLNKSFNKSSSITYKKEIIPMETFIPKTYEKEQCWQIAKKLGETDMRFMLSCLKKYGISHIERTWGIFQEMSQEKIKNPRKYFNKLISTSYEGNKSRFMAEKNPKLN
jgi:hypothetical protein